MIKLNVCPSTLAQGFDSYSPIALKMLFDGKKVLPFLPFPSPSAEQIEAKEALQNIGRISLSGVQPKFSMLIGEDLRLYYARENEQGTYILKPRPNAYHLFHKDFCAAYEHLTMQIAAQVYRLETAPNGLCFFKNDEAAYITRRFDVRSDGGKYQQEDFASLLGYTRTNGGSDFKYCNGNYEECAEVIHKHVKAAPVSLLNFFRLIVFNFITLNDDAHLKNFSLINIGNEYRLAPGYDLINTSLHLTLPRIFALDKGLFKEGMSFSDIHSVQRKDFEEFGKRINLPEKLIERELNRFAGEYPLTKELIESSFLSQDLKRQYELSMNYRRKLLAQ